MGRSQPSKDKLMKISKRLLLAIVGVFFLLVSYADSQLKAESSEAIYHNYWPVFSIAYPNHWIKKQPERRIALKVEAPERYPVLRIAISPGFITSSKRITDLYLSEFEKLGDDINLIYDRDVVLEDGTKAREMQIKWVPHDEPKQTTLILTAKKEGSWISIFLSCTDIEIGENLRKIPYSLKIRPAKEVSPAYRYKTPEKTDDGWSTAHVAEVNLDEKKLTQLITKILDGTYRAVHSVLVVKSGKLVLEAYFPGQDYKRSLRDFTRDDIHQVMSVTKSFTSTLIGIAIDKGMINGTDVNLASFFPEYEELFAENYKKEITLKHMLTMTAGFDWDETTYRYNDPRNPIRTLYGPERDNIVGYLLSRPMKSRPGSKFNYDGGLSVLLGVILEKRTELKVSEFADQYLFGPLGITKYTWGYYNFASKVLRTSGGLSICPRDMAKLGQLFVNKGQWNGRQVISSAWIKEAIQTHVNSHPSGLAGYGYQWWRYKFKRDHETVDAYAAMGWGGQRIIVFPALNMVVVFTAGDHLAPRIQSFSMMHSMLFGYILPSVAKPK